MYSIGDMYSISCRVRITRLWARSSLRIALSVVVRGLLVNRAPLALCTASWSERILVASGLVASPVGFCRHVAATPEIPCLTPDVADNITGITRCRG